MQSVSSGGQINGRNVLTRPVVKEFKVFDKGPRV